MSGFCVILYIHRCIDSICNRPGFQTLIQIFLRTKYCFMLHPYQMCTAIFSQGQEFAHRFFQRIACFCVRKSGSLMKMSESLLWLFCHEQPERITHSHSFKERLIEERPQEPFALGLNTAENQIKTVKNIQKIRFFSESLVL